MRRKSKMKSDGILLRCLKKHFWNHLIPEVFLCRFRKLSKTFLKNNDCSDLDLIIKNISGLILYSKVFRLYISALIYIKIDNKAFSSL